ncbi:MAG: transaldolase [Myxococcales bacterium]|nr:transaldolase [Myxococcales bacterium]
MSKVIQAIEQIGQSLWLDYIRRESLKNGELARQVTKEGIVGLTSNPSIFEQAIAHSKDYDEALTALLAAGKSDVEIYEALVVEDIQLAADILRKVYDKTDGRDGYVSLEVSPLLARDTKATIEEAKRLHKLVDRPNLLIKVPGTAEGLPAIRALIAEGVSVNVTLIFSQRQYLEVWEAFVSGMEDRQKAKQPLKPVASVASFFVSRIDSAVDAKLPAGSSLQGKAAIANAKAAYQQHLEAISGERWRNLAADGARVQRMLWASTSTKNPSYPDTMYVDNLIGPNTVNTLPPQTHKAFLDHGKVSNALTEDLAAARRTLQGLPVASVNLEAVCDDLVADGVKKFADAYTKLIAAIASRRK